MLPSRIIELLGAEVSEARQAPPQAQQQVPPQAQQQVPPQAQQQVPPQAQQQVQQETCWIKPRSRLRSQAAQHLVQEEQALLDMLWDTAPEDS